MAGAGPAGCAAAIAAAQSGLAVALLDKVAAFPREKACGDALTPRSVATLSVLGIGLPASAHPVRGLAAWGRQDQPHRYGWPTTSGLPDVGYTVPRRALDDHLMAAAREAGVTVFLGQAVTGPLLEDARVTGVVAASGRSWRAPLVIDALGASSNLGRQAGLPRLPGRPPAVAVRAYMRGAGIDDDWLHSWLALDGPDHAPLPGYGWVFPLGDGMYNVGVGQLATGAGFRHTDYRRLLQTWVSTLPASWQLSWDDSPIVGAALPMGIDRASPSRPGLLLVGDAAGLVNPFNGEGVSYALESGRLAGRSAASTVPGESYSREIAEEFGRYFAAGRLFAKMMGHQRVLDACLHYGLPRPAIMRPVNKLMANLIAPQGGPLDDRLLRGALRLMRKPPFRGAHLL